MIDFNNVPKVALDFMNNDHEEATCITNELMSLVEAEAIDPPAIANSLSHLLKHCQEHFAREEAQMQQIQFPPYPVHKSEHERVLTEMEGELSAWQSDADLERLKHYLFATLTNWFIDHIACMDTVTAQFIARMGGPFETE